MLLRARILVPMSLPPIQDGALWVAGGRVRAIGKWRDVSRVHTGAATDLGDVMVLPGLVNPHCHLDYTAMAGQIPPPRTFTAWLSSITTSKSGLTYSDWAESWLS